MDDLLICLRAAEQLVGVPGPISLRAGLLSRTGPEMTDDLDVGVPGRTVGLSDLVTALETIPPECWEGRWLRLKALRQVDARTFEFVWASLSEAPAPPARG